MQVITDEGLSNRVVVQWSTRNPKAVKIQDPLVLFHENQDKIL